MKVDYTLMSGGLDLVSGSVGVQPGSVAEALNFEQVFGKVGYRRVDGYERFDGRPQPHLAHYYVLASHPFAGNQHDIGQASRCAGRPTPR